MVASSTRRWLATVCLTAVCVASCSSASPEVSPAAQTEGGMSNGGGGAGTEPQRTTTDEAVVTEQAAGLPVESEADSEEQTASPPPTVLKNVAPSVDPGALAGDDAELEALVEPALQVAADVLEDPTGIDEDVLFTVAQGAALDEMRAMAAEFEVNGWTQSGAPVVVSTELTALDEEASPPEATVSVCLDHGDVEIVDASGDSVVDPDARTRSLNILELEYVQERWVLVARSFPDDPSC